MERLTAYCDLDFLDLFYCLEPERSASEWDEDDRAWVEVHGFLREGADVVVAADDRDLPLLLERRPYLRYLINPVGRSVFRFDPSALDKVGTPGRHNDAADVWRVYLLDGDTHTPNKLRQHFGIWSSTAEEVREDWRRLGRDLSIPVGRPDVPRSITAFGELEGLWSPLSSLIVTDKYLFGSKEQARENLIPLLAALLQGEESERRTEVLLVGNHEEAWVQDADEVRAWVQRELEPSVTSHIQLSVVLIPQATWRKSRLHDRRLFLSYGYVRSGDSINSYFRSGKPSASSHLAFRPLTNPDAFALAKSELKDVAAAVSDTPDKLGLYPLKAGDMCCRLLDAVRLP